MAMARSIERSAATVEAAIEAALAELGLTDQEARIDIIQEPKAGFLGVGGQEAVVRVSATTPEVEMDDLEEQADAVADFLDQLLAKMDIDAIAEPNPEGGQMYVDIVDGREDDMALLIGRHGQTLDAIQELTRMIVGTRLDERIRVIVDIGDYRKRRIARIQDHARELAEKVARDRPGGGTRADESVRAEARA